MRLQLGLRPSSSPRPRTVLLVLVALTTLLAVLTLVGAEPAQAGVGGGGPFPCDGSLYVTTGTPTDMALHRVDQDDGSLVPVGDGGLLANALAFDPVDRHLYGMSRDHPHTVVRVDSEGDEVDLGPPSGAPAGWEVTAVGTFLDNGHYLVLGDTEPPGAPVGSAPAVWAEINVRQSPPNVVRTFSHPSVGTSDLWDVALDPTDGELYAFSRTQRRIVRIDEATGEATPTGPVFDQPSLAGSAFFDSFGRLWLYGSRSASNDQDTLFRIDDVATDTPRVVGRGPLVTQSDGASCPFSVAMDKTAVPRHVCAGERVTYQLTLTNETLRLSPAGTDSTQAGGDIVADLVDQLPAGLTYVPGSLVNPVGGTVNAYGGTRRLEITGLTIPEGQARVVEVAVDVPPGHPAGVVENQAALGNLSGNVGPLVLSEDPETPSFPDPTRVEVRACSDLGVEKAVALPAIAPGDRAEYSLTVTNHGPSVARAVDSVVDVLPAGTTFVSASDGGSPTPFGTVAWPAFDLAVGEQRTLGVTVEADRDVDDHADDDGLIVNTVRVDHPGDDDPGNDEDDATLPVTRPDLMIEKDDGRTTVAPGDEATYTLEVTNHGNAPARGALVTDRLPEGTRFVAASSGATVEDGVVSWPAVDLGPGDAMEATVTVRVDDDMAGEDTVVNVARVDHPDDRRMEDNEDDDVDELEPVAVDDPTGNDLPWLPRTGAGLVAPGMIGLGLVLLGITAWLASRQRLP